jgi:hypothetical protein
MFSTAALVLNVALTVSFLLLPCRLLRPILAVWAAAGAWSFSHCGLEQQTPALQSWRKHKKRCRSLSTRSTLAAALLQAALLRPQHLAQHLAVPQLLLQWH